MDRCRIAMDALTTVCTRMPPTRTLRPVERQIPVITIVASTALTRWGQRAASSAARCADSRDQAAPRAEVCSCCRGRRGRRRKRRSTVVAPALADGVRRVYCAGAPWWVSDGQRGLGQAERDPLAGRRVRDRETMIKDGGRGMDWYLDGDDRASLSALRREIRAYLGRHGEVDCDLSDAELVVEEIVGNAVRHAGGSIWVSLSWLETSPVLTVRDLGPGFDPARLSAAAAAPLGEFDTGDPGPGDLGDRDDRRLVELDVDALAEGGRGLFLVTHLAPVLEAEARQAGGMTVRVELPVKKPPAVSYDPPRRTIGALPALSEARPEGGFSKESFLRALVVQLARTLELNAGPDAAAAAVAQVGIDVGGQMEEEFRVALSVTDRLTPEQLAHCYVRLKHAIDGGFYVVEANEERIVLGNRRCPFGDVVQLAPSLCRMTSSVFGGIAARSNDEGAAVLLEERIAVGDPGCRVVVYLQEPPASTRPLTHQYTAQIRP